MPSKELFLVICCFFVVAIPNSITNENHSSRLAVKLLDVFVQREIRLEDVVAKVADKL